MWWSFGDNDVDITKFIVSSDSDHNEGNSVATFAKSPAGYGVFSGTLDSTTPEGATLPEGQTIKRTGWANIKNIRHKVSPALIVQQSISISNEVWFFFFQKSFQRKAYYDWTSYNTMVVRVRGDGRPYMINLTCDGFFDINWMDMYSYILYTRGGPHWQTTRVWKWEDSSSQLSSYLIQPCSSCFRFHFRNSFCQYGAVSKINRVRCHETVCPPSA